MITTNNYRYLFITLIMTSFTTLVFSYVYLTHYDENHAHIVNTFESNKAQVYLYSKYLSQVASSRPKSEMIINSNIYSSDMDSAVQDEIIRSIYTESQKIYSQKLSWLSLFDLIYIKMYKYDTIISSRPMPILERGDFDISFLFSKDYCKRYTACAKYIDQQDLDDDVVFSEPHIDIDTNALTITLIAPIYLAGEIIGDVQTDIHLSHIPITSVSQFSHHVTDGMLYLDVYNYTKLKNFSRNVSVKLDNNVILVMHISYIPIFLFMFSSLVLFGAFFFLALLYSKKQIAQTELEYSSMIDELTGCYNRKVLKSDELREKISRSESNFVISIDGNKLKNINDNYGHYVGDLAIKTISSLIKAHFPAEDYVVRYGGDEFVTVAIDKSKEWVIGKIEQVIEELGCQEVYQGIFVNVSFGISQFESYEMLDDAIKEADRELYRHKNSCAC